MKNMSNIPHKNMKFCFGFNQSFDRAQLYLLWTDQNYSHVVGLLESGESDPQLDNFNKHTIITELYAQ